MKRTISLPVADYAIDEDSPITAEELKAEACRMIRDTPNGHAFYFEGGVA